MRQSAIILEAGPTLTPTLHFTKLQLIEQIID
jgi:hypothetical protein